MQKGTAVAEITHLMSRAAGWPRAALDRAAHQAVAAADEEPDRVREGHRMAVLRHRDEHPGRRDEGRARQPSPAVHRRRTASTLLLKTGYGRTRPWGCGIFHRRPGQVNCGWVAAANIAADLSAWCRLLGLYDCDDLKDAEPDTLRYRLWQLPARLVRHARTRVLKISRTWPWKDAFWPAGNGCAPCPHRSDQPPVPATPEEDRPGAVKPVPSRACRAAPHLRGTEPDTKAENRHQHRYSVPPAPLNHRGW